MDAKLQEWPRVSVVISNYNGMMLNILDESLASILENDYPNLEVIFVDNASTDNSVSWVKRKFKNNPRLTIVQNPINMYSQGLNLGIRRSSGEYVAFFNNDVVVENGHFQKFVAFLTKHPKIALAQGKLLSYFDHDVIDSAGETMDTYGTPITIGARISAKDHYNETTKVLSVSGSCSILRKSVVSDVGYFDDDYGIGYEDLDLALRSWLKGYEVVCYPVVIAFHKRGVTDASSMVKVKVKWHFNKNRFMTVIKNYPIFFIMTNLPVMVLIYVLAGLVEIIIRRNYSLGLTRFTSMIWIICYLCPILKKRKEIQRDAKKAGRLAIERLLYKKSFTQSLHSYLKTK